MRALFLTYRVEDGKSKMCGATLLGRDTTDDLGAIVQRLLRVEGALLAREALHDHLGVLIDPHLGGCAHPTHAHEEGTPQRAVPRRHYFNNLKSPRHGELGTTRHSEGDRSIAQFLGRGDDEDRPSPYPMFKVAFRIDELRVRCELVPYWAIQPGLLVL